MCPSMVINHQCPSVNSYMALLRAKVSASVGKLLDLAVLSDSRPYR